MTIIHNNIMQETIEELGKLQVVSLRSKYLHGPFRPADKSLDKS